MKRSGKRLLAVLLCLAMALSLLPMSALAARRSDELPAIPADGDAGAAVKAELPADAADDFSAVTLAGTVMTDGVTSDTWERDAAADATANKTNISDSVCEKTADGVHLKASTTDGNSHGAASNPGSWPGVFLNKTANEALARVSGDKFVEVTLKRTGGSPRFGIILNYNSPTDGFFVGCNTNTSGWFTEGYKTDGTSNYQGLPSGGATPAEGAETTIRIEWNQTKLIRVLQDGQQIIGEYTFQNTYTGTGVGFRMNYYSAAEGPCEYYIKEMHYSGQATVSVYNVSGTVKDNAASPKALAGVEVTAAAAGGATYTATTNANGAYTLENLVANTYTLTFRKQGYKTTTLTSVVVSSADVTGKNATMEETDVVTIPTDGAKNGDWTQVASTKLDDSAVEPAVEEGELLLTSGKTNGHKLSSGSKTAVFTSQKMTDALAEVAGERTVSFTLTPECVKGEDKSNVTDYIAFGIALNASGDNTGYGISFSSEDSGDANKWLVQQFVNGSGSGYATLAQLLPEVGVPMDFEITWTDSAVTIKINGETLSHGVAMGNVPRTNTVAFTAGGKSYRDLQLQNEPRQTRIRISNLHYSGQETVEARYVKGAVTCGGKAVEGATVTVANDPTGAYTQTTDSAGKYTVALPIKAEAYTLSATKDGYNAVEKTVTVTEEADKTTLAAVDFALTQLPTISGVVKDTNGKPIRGAEVVSNLRPENAPAAVTDENGAFTVIGAVDGTHTLTVSAEGYDTATKEVAVSGASVSNVEIALEEYVIPFYTLKTADMEVKVARNFPQVIEYKMLNLKDAQGNPKTMHGQTAELDTIVINGSMNDLADPGVEIVPTVTSVFDENDPTKVTYTMVIDGNNNATTGVTATITAEICVGLDDVNDANSASKGRTLGFYITNVVYAGADDAAKAANRLAHPIDNIEIPNHSLVSVRSTEEGARVTGAKLASNSVSRGDTTYDAAGNEEYAGWSDNYFAAFVYNDGLSAGLASNSAFGTGSAGSGTYPVHLEFEGKDGGTSVALALSSTKWYYDHNITRDEAGGDQKLTNEQLSLEERIIAPLDMPFAKVVIAGDENGNGTVDWQDGAVAYRETVMHIPAGSDVVPDSVNLRISMNFGSMATNPFLIALDNVKRVAANTDGLGQFVLLKGYAGEGHDSNHPQYNNIGIRMGGPDDLKTLLTEGGKLGANFGIHVNASEFYTEAIQDENQPRRNTNGSLHYGWNWLDQGIAINAVYDYASGKRAERWDALYEIVKDHPFLVYVDVWGNYTSGTENDFMTRALSNEIISHDKWRIAHEWSYGNPYESTFQHWVTDYTYGDYSDKGKLNSNVIRFLLNQYKDSFPPDFATFGGAANAPLLGGPAMQGFEGWQGDGEYNLSIYNTFNQMVYTKFLQHYSVMEWTNASAAVAMPYSQGANGARSKTADWTPETQIKLSDGTDSVVVTRGTSGKLVTNFGLDTVDKFLAGETEYRSRVITLNNKEILRGAPASAGEDNAFPASAATLQYLIPWYWDANGDRVTADKEKLYHWNAQGGQSTWELPDGWEDLGTVILYELSDQGRDAGKTVKVINGTVTLSGIKKNTGYVVVKGESGAAAPAIEYGTGLYLKDPSFNMDTARADSPWDVDENSPGSAIHTTNSEGIGILKMTGEVSISQKMNGLVAGKTYVSYVAVDNRSNAKASMTITDGDGNVVATNYTVRSIAKNYISSYYLHNNHGAEAGGSYFQNMFVYFTAEAGKEYTMTLSREAGAGSVYFDDLRTVEYGFNYSGFGAGQTAQNEKGSAELPVIYDAQTGAVTELHQDFENVAQGIWPFVVGPAEGIADNRVHVSELNKPYTQAGWDVKKLDDVIDGNWSIKVNGLSGYNNLVYQTIPQNFRFEPDKVYTVSFDYELGSAGSYIAVVGDGAYTNLSNLTVYDLEQTLNLDTTEAEYEAKTTTAKAAVGHVEFTVVGSKSGQTWVGIYSKDRATVPDGMINSKGEYTNEAKFGGYLDFVLDNLSIELAPPVKNALALLLQEGDTWVREVYIAKNGGDTAAAWAAFEAALEAGHGVFDNDGAIETEVSDAVTALQTAMDALEKVNVKISGTVTNVNDDPVAGVVLTLENSAYIPVGLTVTTGEDGTYEFVSKGNVELVPGTYRIKAQATGYNVQTTTEPIVLTSSVSTKTKDIELVAENPGAYVNDFNTGDISMMGFLVPEETEDLPTLAATEFDGSGALKIVWNAGDGETRHLNNVVDKTVTMANGSFSFDVTPLTNNGIRFGITFRGQEGTAANANRVFVGQEDGVKKWFVEYWNSEGSPTSAYIGTSTKDIGLDQNVTRNVRAVIDGKSFQVYVDGVEIYDVNASTSLAGMSTEAGYVGFNMRLQAGSEYIIDNLRIVRADTAEGVYNVSGAVEARSGVSVSGAAVELYNGETRVAGTTTNALGEYQISRVAPGRYTLKASAPFFQGAEKTVTVGNANVTAQDFTLVPDISSLTTLIAEVEALTEEDYTEESWAALATALTAAKAIDGESSIAQLNTAYRDLSNAKDGLVLSERAAADFSQLRALYNEKFNVANDNYTIASWAAFQTALEDARKILLAGTALQPEVEAAKDALTAASEALERATPPEEMDLTKLQAAYDKAAGVEQGNYTDATWAAFVEARDAALAILSNSDGLTQDEVDAAEKALTDAQSGLRAPSPSTGGGSIPAEVTTTETRDDGAKVTTVTKADGSKVETVEQADGSKTEAVTTPAGDVTITATDANGEELAKVEIPATIPEPETKFEDLDTVPWAQEAVNNVAALELVKGTGGNKYDPVAPMTRGSLATVLHRLSNGKTDYQATFKDVAQGKYYTEGVAWAAKANVVKGISEDVFAPDDIITREQLAVMLARYAKLIGMDTKADATKIASFADGDETGSWAVDGVAWCVQNGILKGKGGNALDPTAEVSRAEVAVMLDRFIALIQK